jgi:hypothetical protein
MAAIGDFVKIRKNGWRRIYLGNVSDDTGREEKKRKYIGIPR